MAYTPEGKRMPKTTLNRQQALAIAELAEMHGHIEIAYDYGSYLIVSAGSRLGRTKVWTTGKIEDAP